MPEGDDELRLTSLHIDLPDARIVGREHVRRELATKVIALAVVPHDLVAAGPPLEHAPLLPIPGARCAEFAPRVAVSKVDDADGSAVGGARRAVLEIDLFP